MNFEQIIPLHSLELELYLPVAKSKFYWRSLLECVDRHWTTELGIRIGRADILCFGTHVS
jgi:hypothetical protein